MTFKTRRGRAFMLGAWALLTGVLSATASAQTVPEMVSRAGHVLRRVEYGVRHDELPELLPLGNQNQNNRIITYLTDQLYLRQSENNQTNKLVGLYPSIPALGSSGNTNPPAQPGTMTIEELSEMNIVRALFSEYQLREKMTQFWQRHFTNSYWSSYGYFRKVLSQAPYNYTDPTLGDLARRYSTYFEWFQNDEFRTHALGTFRDLLRASAERIPMTIYLSTVDNKAPTANENYARELMEVHTLGRTSYVYVGNNQWQERPNYSYDDIVDIAKTFSGWTVSGTTNLPPTFSLGFNKNDHINTPAGYTLFDSPYTSPYVGTKMIANSPNDRKEGQAVLDHLCGNPITANFVSRKLIKLFVTEDELAPDDPLVFDCIAAWGPNGDIKAVLAQILASPRFQLLRDDRWDLARLPMEGIGQTVDTMWGKAYNPNDSAADNRKRIEHVRMIQEQYLGQQYFRYPSPEGFPMDSFELLTTVRIMGLNRLRQELYGKFSWATYPWVKHAISFEWPSLIAWYAPAGLTQEDDLRDFLMLNHFYFDEGPFEATYLNDFIRRDSAGNPATKTLADDANNNFPEYEARMSQIAAFAASMSLNNLK